MMAAMLLGGVKPKDYDPVTEQCREVNAASAGASSWAKAASASEPYKGSDSSYEVLRKRVEAMEPEVQAFKAASENLMVKFFELHASVQRDQTPAVLEGLAPFQQAAVTPQVVVGKVARLAGPLPPVPHGDPNKPTLLVEDNPSLSAPIEDIRTLASEGGDALAVEPVEPMSSLSLPRGEGSDIIDLVVSAAVGRTMPSSNVENGEDDDDASHQPALASIPSFVPIELVEPKGPLLPPCLRASTSCKASTSFSGTSGGIGHHKKKSDSGTNFTLRDMWKELYLANELKADEHLDQHLNLMSEKQRFDQKTQSSLAHTPVLHHRCKVWDPISSGRIFWDFLGLCFVMVDFVLIPPSVAWEVETPYGLAVFTACFWLFDFLAVFNTAYYWKDQIIKKRYDIAKNYIKGWFLFDLVLLALEWALIIGEGKLGIVHSAKTARALRINRLFRVSRLSRLKQVVDDWCVCRGHDWVLPFLTVLGLMLGILLTMHVFGCAWFLIGMWSYNAGHEANWVSEFKMVDKPPVDQYVVAIQWVLSFIASAPVLVVPVNGAEFLFTIMVQFISLLIIGGTVSQLASTLSELNARYHERNRLHMSLRQYLVASQVPADLHQRILRFADHSLRMMASRTTEMEPKVAALLSQELRVDLVVVQYQQYLCLHPLLNLFQEGQVEVFRTVCGAIKMQAFEECMKVFSSAQWAQCMYITTNGTFRLYRQQHGRLASLGFDIAGLTSRDLKTGFMGSMSTRTSESMELSLQVGGGSLKPVEGIGEDFSEPHWFAEASLFANVVHHSTLVATTFADALTLSPGDLYECVTRSPICILTIHEYALDYLATVKEQGLDDELPVEVSEKARDATQLYKMRQIQLLGKQIAGVKDALKSVDNGQQNFRSDQQEFLKRALSGEFDGGQLAEGLEQCFRELHPTEGAYAALGEEDERKRSIAAVVSILEILADRYSEFTEPQPSKGRMSRKLWRIMRHLICSRDFDDTDVVHALAVLLAVRGLGKAKKFVQLCPVSCRRSPESAVTFALSHMVSSLPSVACLKTELVSLLPLTLGIQEQFNFAQWLQGENTPSRIQVLNQFIQTEEGNLPLKFYLLYLVGIMCGIAGTKNMFGSAFMTEQNCWNVVYGIQTLRKFHDLTPQNIYWEFIALRVQHVGLCPTTDAQFAFSRLVCLNRAWSMEEIEKLSEAWETLEPDDQKTLTQHMLADGIHEQALMLVFVPLYFVHARENPAVGLSLALTVMAELIVKLRAPGTLPEEEKTVRVDLRDLAAFAKDVRLQSNFAFCLEHAKITQTEEDEVRVLMTAKNWQRMNDMSGPSDVLPELARDVKQVLRKQVRLHDSILTRVGAPPTAVHEREEDLDLVCI